VTDRIEAAVDDLDATIKDIRRSIFALGASEGTADLQSELTAMVDRAAATMKFRPTLQLEGPVRTLVTDDIAPHLLAVLGETLSNAARHANASRVAVTIQAGEVLRLTVADNGIGMPADGRESGLRNIRARAEQLGGSCTVGAQDGGGTIVSWTVPLASQRQR
jgi:signal transduction histidine kinase